MQGSDSFRLVVRRGPQPNQIYELNKDILTIGRDITNDIVINDPEVSRHHMRFTRGAGGFTLEDLGSTNGTFINGQRLSGARPLSNGDMIGLGETVTLGYEIIRPTDERGAPPSAPPPAPSPEPEQPLAQPVQPPPSAPADAPPAQPSSESAYAYGPAPAYEAPPQPPPSMDYDYDPYAVREDEPRGVLRWIVIGCLGIGLFCCCITVASLVVIDQQCLWNDIPILADVLEALDFAATCA